MKKEYSKCKGCEECSMTNVREEEILEEARLFAKTVKNLIWFLAVLCCIITILSMSSCVRTKTTTTHTRDTIYVEVHDTTTIAIHDTLAVEKIHHKIDTIFSGIEKDCPNEKPKLNIFKQEIEDECTIESLTGGSISIYFPKLRQNITIKFFGNKGIVVEDGKQEIITDKTETEIVRQLSTFRQIINTWYMWLPFWLFIALIILLKFIK